MDTQGFSNQPETNGGISGTNSGPVGESSAPVQEETEEFSLANPFLNGMPDEHRRLLSPYVKQWDGQVTKKFQDYSSRLKPYESLGPAEELQRYKNFADNFRYDPESLFKLMWQALSEQYGDDWETELLRILELQEMSEQGNMDQSQGYQNNQGNQGFDSNGQGYPQQPVGQPGYPNQGQFGQPDPNQQFQQNMMKELDELRQWKNQFEQSQNDAQEQAQLDQVLQQMHNQFGAFDDGFVLLQLSQHGDVQKAMDAWNHLLGQYSSQQTPARQAPKIMGGQGGVPSGQVETEKLRGKDRRSAVENMLAQLEG
jgi:hypothetical protein